MNSDGDEWGICHRSYLFNRERTCRPPITKLHRPCLVPQPKFFEVYRHTFKILNVH